MEILYFRSSGVLSLAVHHPVFAQGLFSVSALMFDTKAYNVPALSSMADMWPPDSFTASSPHPEYSTAPAVLLKTVCLLA